MLPSQQGGFPQRHEYMPPEVHAGSPLEQNAVLPEEDPPEEEPPEEELEDSPEKEPPEDPPEEDSSEHIGPLTPQ